MSAKRGQLPIRWGLIAALALPGVFTSGGAALVVRVFAAEAFEFDGPSMEPTLLDGDRFIVEKSAYGLFLPFGSSAVATWNSPQIGDVAVIRTLDDFDIVKRVVAVGGDTVEIRQDAVFVNGHSLRRGGMRGCEGDSDCVTLEEGWGDRSWSVSQSQFAIPDSFDAAVVPEGHVFVLGDHRDRSNDSRNPSIGMIPVSRLKGRAAVLYWSHDYAPNVSSPIRWGRIGAEVH